MSEYKIDNLVICSTLNQITNYLIIEKYRPKRIFNITYNEEARGKMNISMKNEEWDVCLDKEIIGKYEFKNNIEIFDSDMYSLTDMKNIFQEQILDKVGNQKIYWHITGGQRTIALAINDLVKEQERIKDKVMYIEGNTEKLIINKNNDELITGEDSYGCGELTFKRALRLTGFDTKKLKSTTILKEEGKGKIDEYNKEYKFYEKLYEIIVTKRENKIEVNEQNKDTLRNLLLKSNRIKNSEGNTERQDFIKQLFEKILEEYKSLKEIGYYQNKKDNKDDNEFNKSYPAGYIFEKLTAYKIYDLIKKSSKIVGMETSLKTYFKDVKENEHNEKNDIIDELDIVLLTDTGKIINFECKSGGMKGDNAKSHNYTTYRLSGVFGMPILLLPLYNDEASSGFKNDNNILKKPLQALNAAKAAELEVITIDRIEKKLKDLRIIEDK
ncbi:hypothetical protein CF055_00760 [Clostridium botulinum]|uniref:hypothetical protein n=1 Tax=Clostridium botulinum TaxID=1491 RepID=UPI000C780C8B|nr:hypothetical protein [Clostridium botulinum]AUM88164.1 hypothetical protein RSJ15_10835 [Clostridium botulinum]NFO68704.1 hypothetical protein [Clostridium botulinum]